ncbi:MAG: hypothetical protein GY730_04195 [bacterium]|nr:hypothetical protein [bacterium]
MYKNSISGEMYEECRYLKSQAEELELKVVKVKEDLTSQYPNFDAYFEIQSGIHRGKSHKERFFYTEDKKVDGRMFYGGKRKIKWFAAKCGCCITDENGNSRFPNYFCVEKDLVGKVVFADAVRKKDFIRLTNFKSKADTLETSETNETEAAKSYMAPLEESDLF